MAGSILYVQLDVNYADDEKIVNVSTGAELLYVRGLCFSKRMLSDGRIATGQLVRLASDIPDDPLDFREVFNLAAELVRVGLWIEEADGWRIAAWKRHNATSDEVEEKRQAKKTGAVLGNHKRWHLGDGRPSQDCRYCQSEGLIGSDSQDRSHSDSTEEETEEEEETEPTTSEPEVSDAAHDLCRVFAVEHCKRNSHGVPSEGSQARKKWLVEMDRLVRLGPPNVGKGVDPERIRHVILGMAEDTGDGSFPGWSSVCASVPKFREKFTQIAAAVDAKSRNGARASPEPRDRHDPTPYQRPSRPTT